jgi:hypothetical protein
MLGPPWTMSEPSRAVPIRKLSGIGGRLAALAGVSRSRGAASERPANKVPSFSPSFWGSFAVR